MVALSPEVEYSGLVLPSLKSPQADSPRLFAPQKSLAFLDQSASSLQLNPFSGHSSTSAIGRGMATVSGLVTIGSACFGKRPRVSSFALARANDSHAPPAGDHTSGGGPSSSSQPRASARIASPEFLS